MGKKERDDARKEVFSNNKFFSNKRIYFRLMFLLK
jgi:hypothetical protein